MSARSPLHATAVALAADADGPLAGVLILGASGAGKSSLALLALDTCPFRRSALVADDAVEIEAAGERLVARAPRLIDGLMEVRGLGPAPTLRHVSSHPLHVAVDLDLAPTRLPEERWFRPVSEAAMLPLYAFQWAGAEATAAARLRFVARAVLCGQIARPAQDRGPAAGPPPD